MNFTVEKNKNYQILEKPDARTPKGLRAIGKSKMGGRFFELASCPYNPKLNRYDTGLDKYSREFYGKSDAEIEKILDDRKELVEYYKSQVDAFGGDESDFLAQYKLELRHNERIDTSIMDNYLKLYLVMRGAQLTPEGERGNIGKYSSSMYMIIDPDSVQKVKHKRSSMAFEAITWLGDKLANNRDEAIEYLKYTRVIGIKQSKTDDVIKSVFQEKIKDFDFLETFLDAVKTKKRADVQLALEVRKAIFDRKIRKEGNEYVFEGVTLGTDEISIVRSLKKTEFAEVADKIFQ